MKQPLKKLPIDVSTFETIINEGYIYVDKTEYIYNLVTQGRYYFLSRPRRFGKSLLVSTLKSLFLNNKELFKGLWIESSTYQWEKYPVIHLDLSTIPHLSVTEFRTNLNQRLITLGKELRVAFVPGDTPEVTLFNIAQQIHENAGKLVILIDEYDKPILDSLDRRTNTRDYRDVLKSFFTVIKGIDAYVHFVLLTGVSKFTKTSIFSGLNNLNDISMKPEAAALLGYTEPELKKYFSEYIQQVAHIKKTSKTAIINEMQIWYNGYRFSRQKIKMYNPFSVLYYLKDKELGNYWFETGTPSFLVELLKQQYEFLENIEDIEWSSEGLGSFDVDELNLITILFQTGYLTIYDYNPHTRKYLLDYPNAETRESFKKYLIAAFVNSTSYAVEKAVSQLATALKNNDIPLFFTVLQSLFAHIPYHLHIEQERYYHSLFQFLGSLLGLEIQSEVITDKGRIDLVITTKKHVYIFELKFKVSAEQALEQIETTKYFERYMVGRKKIILIGASFNRAGEKLTIDYAFKPL